MGARTNHAIAAMLLSGAPALACAHHSIGMIDISAPVWVRATVVRYEPRNPHVILELEERTGDERLRSWTIEGPIVARLRRMSLPRDFLRIGDVIEVCGFPFRKEVVRQHAALPAGAVPLPHVHGMLLVLPDGRRQAWGPYGKLDNCIRPGDSPAHWLQFIHADPMAREYWCKGLLQPEAAVAPASALVEEVNRGMRVPCITGTHDESH